MQNSSGIGDYFNTCIVALGLSGNHPQPFWRSMYAYICMFIHKYIYIYIYKYTQFTVWCATEALLFGQQYICVFRQQCVNRTLSLCVSLSLSLSLFLPSLYLSLSIHRSTYPPLYNIYIYAPDNLCFAVYEAPNLDMINDAKRPHAQGWSFVSCECILLHICPRAQGAQGPHKCGPRARTRIKEYWTTPMCIPISVYIYIYIYLFCIYI